jgi:Myb/SANT-like DNA-binding domain
MFQSNAVHIFITLTLFFYVHISEKNVVILFFPSNFLFLLRTPSPYFFDVFTMLVAKSNFGADVAKESLEAGIMETKHRIRNANWTDRQTNVLLDLLLEKHELGIAEYTEGFWKELCKVLNEKNQLQRSPMELRLRLKTLKADFSDYRYCAEMWGWYWDNEKGLPVAPNDACWDEVTKVQYITFILFYFSFFEVVFRFWYGIHLDTFCSCFTMLIKT